MSALYVLKKRSLLRGRTASQADEDSKADLRLIVLTTAALAFWFGLSVSWLIDWARTPPVKTLQTSMEAKK